jgi:hypothetical protein
VLTLPDAGVGEWDRTRANPVCVKRVFSGASRDPSGGSA